MKPIQVVVYLCLNSYALPNGNYTILSLVECVPAAVIEQNKISETVSTGLPRP